MPKPNQTMLDQLAKTFKSTGNTAPFRGMKLRGEFNDPLNYTIRQRISMQGAPERVKYQKGLESLRGQKMNLIRAEEIDARKRFEKLQDDFEEAYSDAYESWEDDINSNVPEKAPLLEYGFEPSDLNFTTPEADLRDYWPPYANHYDVFERNADELRDEIHDIVDRMDYARSPEYIQQLQRQSPRYRNYQRAMRQRQENAQMGRLNAAIMNLYRRGYSMPEIREILRNQRIR